MSDRTTKTERRRARRTMAVGCRRWGTARTARLLRGGPHARWALFVALAVDVPPEILIDGQGPTLRGQYWTATGEVFDAPYHERLHARTAQALAQVCAELDRAFLQPELERLGLEPGRYTIGFDLTGAQLNALALPGPPLDYQEPEELPFPFELPDGWGRP